MFKNKQKGKTMFGEQLKKYRVELRLTRKDVAIRLNDLHGYKYDAYNIQSWEEGTNPKIDVIIALADVLGIPEQLLFDDSQETINRIVDREIPNFNSFTEHTKKVPLIEGYIGAGSAGYLADEMNVIEYLYVDNQMIAKPYRKLEIEALVVIGDSMQGYVDEQDIILFYRIPPSYNLLDGKYVITTINGTMVKSLKFQANGNIVISSCNKSYPDEIISSKDSQEFLDVIGVVAGRVLKS